MVEQTDVQTPQPAVSSDVEKVHVVVLDSCLYPSPPKKVELVLPKDTTGETLVNKIADECGYQKDAFEVKWGKIMIDAEEQKTLGEIGFPPKVLISASKRQGKEIVMTKTPNMIVHENSSSSAASSSSSSSPALITYGPTLPSSQTSYPYSSSSSSSGGYTSSYSYWNQPQAKSSSGYIGLSNQGATCYMNSLIQTLFMTPEFRNALYNWSFDEKIRNELAKAAQNGNGEKAKDVKEEKEKATTNGTNGNGNAKESGTANGNGNAVNLSQEEREKKERSSIPLQLQRLFARLQLCDVQAVKTKDLTKSFGWEDADAFTQHDVQELCRVLFDALEKNFQGTKQANLVNELYQGKMKDYVQCKECKHESARVDHYLDIPLVIRGFGETIPVKSVEEALHKFVQPEILDKDNQYNCEKCNKKVDAIKGLKIEKFPYLLTLQLKRFDFDFQTMRRIKLNDRVTFPLYLDLNPIINGKNAPAQKPQSPQDEEEEGDDEMEREDKGKGRADNQQDSVEEISQAPQESFDAEPDFEGPPPKVTPEHPYVYELFSVMIHRGSSMGGHYYAYVKSFETNKWYEFNDSIVSEISVSEVKKAFGGDEDGGYSLPRSVYSSYKSNANAYMLMYRQIEPDRNKKPMTTTEIPESLRKVVEDENGVAKQKKKAEELEREMVKMKIYYNGEEKALNMHKSSSLSDTATAALKLFELSEKYTAGNYRLRNYSHSNELPGDTYTGKEHKSLDDLNFFVSHYTSKSLLLETKEANEEFEEFNPSMMLFRVAKYNPTTLGFDATVNVYVNKLGSFGDLRDAVAQKTGVPKDKQNLFKEPSYPSWNAPPATVIDKANDVDLRHGSFMEPEKLYVEFTESPAYTSYEDMDDDDEKDAKEKDEKESPVIAALERIKNIIEVKYNLPGKEEYDQKISVDKNMLIKDFKEKIQPIIGLPVNDFKIKRGSAPHLYELINESESLSDVSVRDGTPLTIEKGKPLKEGEANYTFEFMDLTKDADNFTEMFEVPVHEDMLISDVKQMILPLLQQKGINVSDPTHIRLRDVSSSQYSRRVGKVFQDALTVKKATLYVYSKRVAVQILDEPEPLQNQDDICFFIQQFKPSTFELTRKEDFVISEDATIDELREKLGAKYGIDAKNVGVVRVDAYYNFYDDPDLLEVPEMSWDRPTIAYSVKNTVGDTMMMRNGYLMLFRDNSEPLKELTKEEKDAIKKETNKRKAAQNQTSSSSYSFWNRKERALKIHSEG